MNLAIVGYRDFNNFVVCENFINETLSKWNIDRIEINKVISGGASMKWQRFGASNIIFH